MNATLQKALGSIVRHVLTTGAGYFVSKGIWTTAEANDYIMALSLGILGVGWSLWDKYKSRIKFLNALDASPGTPEDEISSSGPASRVVIPFVILTLSASSFAACAARGPRAQIRVAAMSIGETALAIDQVERQVYAAGLTGYTKADHDRIGAIVLRVLYAARAFERAAAAISEGVNTRTEALTVAEVAVLAALDDLTKALPAIDGVRDPLLKAIATVRAAITTWIGASVRPRLEDLTAAIV